MKITLVVSSLARGGAERVACMLANFWAQQEKDVTLLRLDHSENPAYPIDLRVKSRSLGLIAQSRNQVQGLFRNLNRIRVLRQAIRESHPDVVISFQSATNVLTLLATRGLRIPVIVSEHSDPSRSSVGRLWEGLRRRTYPLAQALVCPTSSAVKYFQSRIKVKGCAIPNVIALPSAELTRTRPARRSKGYTLIAMGRLIEAKGFDLLLEAFSRIADHHPEWSLRILGEGPLRHQLQSQVEDLGLTDRVHFSGEVADPFPELCAADLFVFPSRHEGFGLALCEAMVCGLPVVSFDCPSGPREIIRNGLDGVLVPPEDIGALSNALHKLMADPEERQRLASRAPEIAVRFSADKVLGLWEELLGSVIGVSAHQKTKAKSQNFRDPRPAPFWLNLAAEFIRRMPAGRYRLIYWLRRGPRKPFLARTPKQLGGDTFHFSFRDQIGRQVFLGGCYEPAESACVRDILRSGMTFVDVGANWGFFTLMAAHLVGPSGKVVAIEADPRIFMRLKQNVVRNCLSQIQVFDTAAADREGVVMLAGHDEEAGNPGISRLVANGSQAPLTFSVRSRQLDSLMRQIGLRHVDLIKIDVEGAEHLVLAGMEEGLRSYCYRSILIEIHPVQLAECGRTPREVIELLSGLGYRGYALDYFKILRKAHYKTSLPLSEFLLPLEINGVQHSQRDLHTIWFCPQ